MVKINIHELIAAMQHSDILWILVPIFFIGIVTDKYQEEFGTSVGNAISNGALIIFTGFSWLQLISSRSMYSFDVIVSQYTFALFIIAYGFAIIASGFSTAAFAKQYGRIRVVTFMLMFFTMMIYVPLLYNFVSILLFVLIFPFYYMFITELVKALPSAGSKKKDLTKSVLTPEKQKGVRGYVQLGKLKMREYLE